MSRRIRPIALSALLIATALWASAQETVRAPATRAVRPDRQELRRQQAARAMPVPAGVQAHRDLEYAKAGEMPLRLDLYVPAKADGPLPLVVFVHGGGWRGGDKRNCRALPLTAHGYAAASVNYRLSGEAAFPAQIYDCKAAIRWLRANAVKYNLDPDRIGVWGTSAGGHLVALLGTSGGVKAAEGALGCNDQSSRVQAVCDWFGPTDLADLGGRNLRGFPTNPVTLLLGGPASEKKNLADLANPITHVSKDDPPFLIMHGDRDPLVPVSQSQALHDALTRAGVSSTLKIIEGAGHGFAGAPHDEMVRAFFDRHLKKKADQETPARK